MKDRLPKTKKVRPTRGGPRSKKTAPPPQKKMTHCAARHVGHISTILKSASNITLFTLNNATQEKKDGPEQVHYVDIQNSYSLNNLIKLNGVK